MFIIGHSKFPTYRHSSCELSQVIRLTLSDLGTNLTYQCSPRIEMVSQGLTVNSKVQNYVFTPKNRNYMIPFVWSS